MNKIRIIDLLNKIANGEVKDKEKFRIIYLSGLTREIYYDENEGCYLNCLKNVSDGYVIYDDVTLNDEVEIIEEDKETEEIEKEMSKLQSEIDLLSNEIGSYHNKIHSMRDRTNYMRETLKDLQKVVNILRKGK